MTLRSLIIGLILAVFVAAFGYANDWVCRLPYVASDLMPVSVFGMLILGLLLLNPLLDTLRLRRLRGAELAIICGLVLTACAIPGPGLLWQFHNALVMPHKMAKTTPGWQKTKHRPALIDYAPKALLVNPNPGGKIDEDDVVNGFVQGLSEGNETMPISQVPWRAWLRPYAFFVPLILLGLVATVCLMLILHTQWSKHEHLPYPIAQFASSLVGEDSDHPFSQLLHNRPFWIGFLFSLLVLLMNGSYAWWPGIAFRIPQTVDLRPLVKLMGWLKQVPGGMDTLLPRFYFVVVGLAFLINAEVSFSIGISMISYSLLFGFLTGLGITVNNEYMAGGVIGFQLFGAYLGAVVFILYTGRHFYWSILKSAFGFGKPPPGCPRGDWICRLFLLATLGMICLLRFAAGIDWLIAVCLVLLFGMLFVNVTRINAETGVLFVQPTWQPIAILLAFFGAHSLGPTPLIVGGILCIVLTVDPRVCLMPLVANALKFGEEQKVKPFRFGGLLITGFAICLAVALPVTLYLQYASGGGVLYGWANTAARMPFDLLGRELNQLASIGILDTAGTQVGWFGLARLGNFSPSPVFLWAAALGFVLVVTCNSARLRWTWWPIHPVMFMVWGTLVSRWFAGSFLLGWIIKWAVVRFGNRETYKTATRFFIGLIAGEMIAGIFWMLVGGIYYIVTETPPPMFRVHP